MSELIYSKKQLNPMIEKYNIDVENDKIFKAIITMFSDKPNYHAWAIKAVFGGVCPLEIITDIKNWAETHASEVKNLIKGNIVAYTTKTDFSNLLKEMEGLTILADVRNTIAKFNTRQRNLLKSHLIEPFPNGFDAQASRTLKAWRDTFKKMEKLPQHRKDKLISTSSALDNLGMLKEHITKALEATYDWNREDMLTFMELNANDCKVVFDKNNVVVLEVPSFASSRKLCGNGRTGWCLTREERYFKQYVLEPSDAKQFFLFDFNKREDNELAHIGFTVRQSGGITNAHSTRNGSMCGEGVKVNGSYINIQQALSLAGVGKNIFMTLKPLKNFKWTEESLLDYVSRNESDVAVSYSDNHRVIVNAITQKGLNALVGHSLINERNYRVSNDSKCYVLFDFNLAVNDDRSTVLINYVKDKYNYDTLQSIYDVFNTNITKGKYLESIGITTDKYLNREAIASKILLHKLIDENNELEATNLIIAEGEAIDVNYEFNNNLPIFKAINNKMYKLFEAIVRNPNFDCSTSDTFGESILISLMYNYKIDPTATPQDDASVKHLIDIILDTPTFDFNVQDINEDSAINIACERPETNWIVEKLAANPKVNIHIVNDFNCAALGNAIRKNNIGAIEILGRRPDLVIRKEDRELAAQHNIDLDRFINPQPMEIADEAKVIKERDINSLAFDLSKLFEKAGFYSK